MTQGKALQLGSILLGILLSVSIATAAGLYKWTDSQGNVHYSQNPPPSGDFNRLKAPPPAPEAPGADEQLQKARDALTSPPPPTGEIADEKQRAEIYQKNCETARKNLEIYTAFRRVFNEKGESVMLTDDERKAKIQESQDMIKKYCK